MESFLLFFSAGNSCGQKTTSHLIFLGPSRRVAAMFTGHDRSKGRSWETKLSKTEVATQNHHLLSRNIWPFASFCSACYKKYEYIIKILHNCVTVNVFHQIPKTSSCLHLQRWLASQCIMLWRNFRWPPHFPLDKMDPHLPRSSSESHDNLTLSLLFLHRDVAIFSLKGGPTIKTNRLRNKKLPRV